MPTGTLGVRWTSDDGKDDLNMVDDAWNGGQWGYNNLQWIGLTYYHKINDYWHIAIETWKSMKTMCRTSTIRRSNAIVPAAVRRSARNYAIQWSERGGLRGPAGMAAVPSIPLAADLPSGRADIPALRQLLAE